MNIRASVNKLESRKGMVENKTGGI